MNSFKIILTLEFQNYITSIARKKRAIKRLATFISSLRKHTYLAVQNQTVGNDK